MDSNSVTRLAPLTVSTVNPDQVAIKPVPQPRRAAPLVKPALAEVAQLFWIATIAKQSSTRSLLSPDTLGSFVVFT